MDSRLHASNAEKVAMRPPVLAPICLVVGALLGFAGTFMSSPSMRALAWGVDGIALVTAGAVLLVYHLRQGHDTIASGFLVFTVGQSLVVSGAAMSLEESAPSFAAGAALWAVSLALVSAPRVFPTLVRASGLIAAALFAATSLQIFVGRPLTPLSEPIPYVAYPFLVLTMFGWAWACLRQPRRDSSHSPA
jgi:hypothetical protein